MPTKQGYENKLKSFEGETLARVIYFDGRDEETNSPYFLANNLDFHNILWGVEFHTISQRRFTLWWWYDYCLPDCHEFSLDLVNDPEWSDEKTRWDVSQLDEWKHLINKKFSRLNVHWVTFTSDKYGHDVENAIPLCVSIKFDTGKTYYVCLAMLDAKGKEFYFGADEVTVFFDDITAKKYKLPILMDNT